MKMPQSRSVTRIGAEMEILLPLQMLNTHSETTQGSWNAKIA